MKTTMILTLILVATLQLASGQQAPALPPGKAVQSAAAPQAQPVPTATAPAPAQEKFIRDPFWPVGYIPVKKLQSSDNTGTNTVARPSPVQQQPGTNAQPVEVDIHWPELKVKGLTKQSNGTYLAIVEGVGIVEEGQLLALQSQGQIFRIKIKGITEKGILQQRLDYKPAPQRFLNKQ